MTARFLLAAGLLAGLVPAQANKVIPATAATTEANDSSYFPFLYAGGSRTQHLIDSGAVTTATGLVREFAYRRDTQDSNAYPGRAIATFKVTIGYSTNSPATMSTTFANNRSGTPVVVHNGSYNVPAQPVVPGPGPWNVVFKLSTPWVYVRTNGHLLIEFEEPGTAQNKSLYLLDAQRANATTGYANTFGDNGPFKSNEAYRVSCPTEAQLKPGGAATIDASGLSKGYPAAAIYGFSRTSYGALPLPFDLAAVGAPKNFAYVSIDLVVPLVLQQAGTTWRGSVSVPIPNLPGLASATLFGQAIFIDAASNAFGSVWSNGVGMTLAGQAPSQLLYQSDSTSADGSLLFSSPDSGGPVIQLTGAFN